MEENVPRKLTNQEFLDKANVANDFKYTYPEEYINNSTKINIICSIHGAFKTSPMHHMKGHGCPKCVGKNKTHDEVVQQINAIHGENYTLMESYKSAIKKINVYCKHHGIFITNVNILLNGYGCPKCSNCYRRTHDEFVQEVKQKLPGYKVLSDFENVTKKVAIECDSGHIYYTSPSNILDGHRCAKCANVGQGVKKTFFEFVQQANKKHNFVYEYVGDYVGANIKTEIVCKKHGPFYMKPSKHLFGQGCPRCKVSNGERTVRSILEQHNIAYTSQHSFEDCRNVHTLKFDFGIFKDKILVGLIEYNGAQHYRPVCFNGIDAETAEKSYIQTCINYNIKKEYCEKNNIPLLEIKYDIKDISNVVVEFCKKVIGV